MRNELEDWNLAMSASFVFLTTMTIMWQHTHSRHRTVKYEAIMMSYYRKNCLLFTQ